LTVVSATFSPLFQPLRHQRNVFHPTVNRFTRKTLPTANRNNFFMNILCIESFCPQKSHNRTLLLGDTLLKHGRHFDYWNQPQNIRMRVCYPDCHEAELYCYVIIHIENLLRQLELLYFHLWRIYWLSSVTYREVRSIRGSSGLLQLFKVLW
jgi:hypothetical protein